MIKAASKIVLTLGMVVCLSDARALKNEGIEVTYEDPATYEKKTVAIKRITDNECRKVDGGNSNVIWGGDYAHKDVPAACKKTFVTTAGILAPMKIAEGIDTLGELEVIEFIQEAGDDEDMIVVDARLNDWYVRETIPSAVNISFKDFDPKSQNFEIVLDNAGIEYEDGKYDFSEAKTMLLFCNGIWCPQSTWAIENLLSIGYPKEKLKWYRGGMYSWKISNLTTVKP